MKYIVIDHEDLKQELFFGFNTSIDHDRMFEAIQNCGITEDRDFIPRKNVVGAGFVDNNSSCSGRSETLDTKSRHPIDTKLLRSQESKIIQFLMPRENEVYIFKYPAFIEVDHMLGIIKAIRFGDQHNWSRKFFNIEL